MNVLLLLIDSLNRHDLEAYNPATFVKSPNLRAFAERGAKMTRHFAGSLPCMPARREIAAGRREWLWRGWGHTEAFDNLIADRARRQGAVTKLITDHYHYFEHGSHGYFESFDGFDFIRGQEIDHWKTDPIAERPAWVEEVGRWRDGIPRDHYYRNTRGFRTEDDWFTPKVFHAIRDWLRVNHTHDKWFLFVDHFEVHEPFYCVEPYRSLYTDQAFTDQNIWPPYQDEGLCRAFLEQVSPEELAYIRAQYWGKVTWVDKYIGMLMDTLTELDLWDDTMVIITTDHGHDLAFHRPRFGKQPPHHDSHAHLPLLVWHPEFANNGREIPAVTSTVDLHATIAEALGDTEPSPHSRSILPVLRGEIPTRREATVTGTFGFGPTIADADYSYAHAPVAAGPIFSYTGYQPRGRNFRAAEGGHFIPGVDAPVWKIPVGDVPPTQPFLIEHAPDPNRQPDLLPERPEVAARLKDELAAIIREEGCPPEQWARMGILERGDR